MIVKCFDDRKAKEELKRCPKIVQDYVKLLENRAERLQDLNNKAISKLREQCSTASL